MAGLVSNALNTVKYNGQDVVSDPSVKSHIESSAAEWNKLTGQNKSAMEYDKSINPTTYGSRWGVPEGTSPADTIAGSKDFYAKSERAGSSGYTPTKWEVDKNQTVEGRIAGLTDPNNPLNQQAATQAKQESARRGLINSSLAVTGGQSAILKTALPIAQQDASTYAQAGQFGANASNVASQFGANAANQAALQNAQLGTSTSIANLNANTTLQGANISAETQKFLGNLNAGTSLATSKLSADTQLALGTLDSKTKTDLQNIVSKNSQLLQANTSAANVASQYMASIAQIQSNDKLTGPAKQQAVDNLLNVMQQQLAVVGEISGLDLSKYFQAATPTNNPNESPGNPRGGQQR